MLTETTVTFLDRITDLELLKQYFIFKFTELRKMILKDQK